MSTANTITSAIFEEQVPAFIREEHDTFVQFLKSYYEFMELDAIPTQIPLIFENPDPVTYTPTNTYAGDFQVGELIEQRANPLNVNEVTASAKIFAWSGNSTSQTAIVTSIGGTQAEFIRNSEILGQKSNAKYFCSADTIALGPGALRASLDLPTSKDINEALSTYVAFIKKEIGANLPTALFTGVNDRTVLKNIRDFYKARGTEDSFKFLFRLLYGENIEIYLPETDMLRASDADWRQVSIIRSTIPLFDAVDSSVPVTTSQLAGRTIIGNVSKATCTVETARETVYNGFRFAELEISNIDGTFVSNEVLRTTNVGDGTSIEVFALGLINDITIGDGGSNYVVGDVVAVTAASTEPGKASGAIIRVATVHANTGAITSLDITEPGYDYVLVPTLDVTGPHNAAEGAARFEAGPLEQIYYNDFSDYTDANSFFSESDNRGARSNVGTTSVVSAGYANVAVNDPSTVTANSILNFTTIPSVGLQGHWKMNSYHDKDVRLNTLDGTFADGNDPVANSASFRGPRLGDVAHEQSRQQPTLQDVQLKYQNFSYTDPTIVGNRDGANSYNSTGWSGFSPVIFDSSGNGHHARVGTWQGGTAYASSPTVNLHSESAFANSGIYGTGNSLGTFAEGGLTLMAHDDIRNANTQTWVVWVKPYQSADTHVDTFAELPTIINRGAIGVGTANGYWAITANTTANANTTGFVDARLTFAGATWDNTNAVTDSLVANTSAQFTGNTVSATELGNLRLGIWNMIALTINYEANADGVGVGNVYFFNTEDGLLCSNGFSIDPDTQSANVTSGDAGWPLRSGIHQGRAVKLGDMSYSANGDSFATDTYVFNGGFDEARYYEKALNIQEIESLFYNPAGNLDKTLAGDWKITTSFGESFSPTVEPAIDFVTDSTRVGEKYLRLGSNSGDAAADGISIVYNKNISFDPNIRYKMTVQARDGFSTNASNCYIGLIGISNTGTDLIGLSNQDDAVGTDSWEYMSAIVQSPGAAPAESGTLSTDWVEFTAVYGGNTSISGLGATSANGSHRFGNGGNTAQLFSVDGNAKREMTWANPAHLHGSFLANTQQGTGNTSFVRPMIVVNHSDIDDSTHVDYIKIEQQKDATLTAAVGPVFMWPGESLSDSGKIGTSATAVWATKYLQDSKFYQVFSYVIKSGLSIETYQELVKKLVHPAGLAMFARVNIEGIASVKMGAFAETASGEILDLLKTFFLGAESVLLEDIAGAIQGPGVTYKTTFSLPATKRWA